METVTEEEPDTNTEPDTESDYQAVIIPKPTSTPTPTPIVISNEEKIAVQLNETEIYLHLNEENEPSEFDFNIMNKIAGSEYNWISSYEDVAEVDSRTGLTVAKNVGSTEICAVVKLMDGTKNVFYATVTVLDNIETIAIAYTPFNALYVGEEFNFDRSFVTYDGSTTKTSSIVRWTVEGVDATIDDRGVFTAAEGGEYYVTARAFQSTEEYDEWLWSLYPRLVLAADTINVIVVNE